MALHVDQREVPKIGERHRSFRAAGELETDAKARRMRFVASDETVDRYGDIIRASGWQLDNFRKNPVLLFGHDNHSVPIGRVTEIDVKRKRLIADVEGRPEGDSELADDVWRALGGGFLNAVSVGFLPTEPPSFIWKDDDEESGIITGFEFDGQDLLELSVVPVPANPQALALARELRISEASQRRLFADDERAVARIAAEQRRRSITLARLRPGFFGGPSP